MEPNRTVDNIPYLSYVSEKKEFPGINSDEFKNWLKEKDNEYTESLTETSLYRDDWFISKFIPVVERINNSDIEILSLPKVFKVKNINNLYKLKSLAQQINLTLSINEQKLLILFL